MSAYPVKHGSLTCVVRLWRETDTEGHACWRGQVEHVASAEVGYVEDVAGVARFIEHWMTKDKEEVRPVLRLRSLLAQDAKRGMLSPQASAAQAEVVNMVSNFLYDKLMGVPTIRQYLADVQGAG